MKQNKKILLGVVVLVLVAAAMVGIFLLTRPEAQLGSKTVTVEVVHKEYGSILCIFQSKDLQQNH